MSASPEPILKSSSARVCVIGGGIIGSWTALHLAEAGVQTTLIEQFPLPHSRGSSHGLSRAFRFLGELELGRLDYSLARWLALQKASGETLFIKTGLLNLGPPGDPELERFMAVLRDGGRPVEWFENETIATRFPMLSYSEGWGAAWDSDGGILIAHRCLTAVQSKFLALGGRIITGCVKSLKSRDARGVAIEVRCNESGNIETQSFDRTVVCAGPWTAKLVPQLKAHLSSLLTPVTYWRDPTGSYSAASGFPIIFNARLTGIYGLPSCEYPDLMKMLYHGGPEADPDERDLVSSKSFVKKVKHYVRDHLPLLDHEKPAIMETCMYTMTPDGNPVIDRLDNTMVIGCGFSGSGFKHSPATGMMLAALALEQDEAIPIEFRADRYTLGRLQSAL
ncbi:MAG: FAD-dependent oxidoreductase [Gammaproteobacteria bacterium]|jgi:sarcosine oxidase/L-pipecolate oxidase|nr:FAD-dependent oxidoreductase [Gammaproteobacteria bacterium]